MHKIHTQCQNPQAQENRNPNEEHCHQYHAVP